MTVGRHLSCEPALDQMTVTLEIHLITFCSILWSFHCKLKGNNVVWSRIRKQNVKIRKNIHVYVYNEIYEFLPYSFCLKTLKCVWRLAVSSKAPSHYLLGAPSLKNWLGSLRIIHWYRKKFKACRSSVSRRFIQPCVKTPNPRSFFCSRVPFWNCFGVFPN